MIAPSTGCRVVVVVVGGRFWDFRAHLGVPKVDGSWIFRGRHIIWRFSQKTITEVVGPIDISKMASIKRYESVHPLESGIRPYTWMGGRARTRMRL